MGLSMVLKDFGDIEYYGKNSGDIYSGIVAFVKRSRFGFILSSKFYFKYLS